MTLYTWSLHGPRPPGRPRLRSALVGLRCKVLSVPLGRQVAQISALARAAQAADVGGTTGGTDSEDVSVSRR